MTLFADFTCRLSLALLFSALESTIISTSLITIGETFGDYTNIEWVVTAYLVTYSSMIPKSGGWFLVLILTLEDRLSSHLC
jgi:MFS family permease